ncbi:hypothetical protein DFH09DRAFT_1320675 [Mycena vulgaris]|nr:hypothetical protein DFH09DRAFT_1320675 [Mycena vulgaris]
MASAPSRSLSRASSVDTSPEKLQARPQIIRSPRVSFSRCPLRHGQHNSKNLATGTRHDIPRGLEAKPHESATADSTSGTNTGFLESEGRFPRARVLLASGCTNTWVPVTFIDAAVAQFTLDTSDYDPANSTFGCVRIRLRLAGIEARAAPATARPDPAPRVSSKREAAAPDALVRLLRCWSARLSCLRLVFPSPSSSAARQAPRAASSLSAITHVARARARPAFPPLALAHGVAPHIHGNTSVGSSARRGSALRPTYSSTKKGGKRRGFTAAASLAPPSLHLLPGYATQRGVVHRLHRASASACDAPRRSRAVSPSPRPVKETRVSPSAPRAPPPPPTRLPDRGRGRGRMEASESRM